MVAPFPLPMSIKGLWPGPQLPGKGRPPPSRPEAGAGRGQQPTPSAPARWRPLLLWRGLPLSGPQCPLGTRAGARLSGWSGQWSPRPPPTPRSIYTLPPKSSWKEGALCWGRGASSSPRRAAREAAHPPLTGACLGLWVPRKRKAVNRDGPTSEFRRTGRAVQKAAWMRRWERLGAVAGAGRWAPGARAGLSGAGGAAAGAQVPLGCKELGGHGGCGSVRTSSPLWRLWRP